MGGSMSVGLFTSTCTYDSVCVPLNKIWVGGGLVYYWIAAQGVCLGS